MAATAADGVRGVLNAVTVAAANEDEDKGATGVGGNEVRRFLPSPPPPPLEATTAPDVGVAPDDDEAEEAAAAETCVAWAAICCACMYCS